MLFAGSCYMLCSEGAKNDAIHPASADKSDGGGGSPEMGKKYQKTNGSFTTVRRRSGRAGPREFQIMSEIGRIGIF